MNFPETRPTLIARLALGSDDADWEQFLGDYWGPIVRFASRVGRLPNDQAEDVASETLLVIVRSQLLTRWQDSPTGKLRSLICGVTRNLLANRQRIDQGRRKLLGEVADAGGLPGVLPVSDSPEPGTSDEDAFYRAWVDELLTGSLRTVLAELHAEGRGDYFRALYGRVCEGLSAAEIGAALGAEAAAVENYLRVAKARLARALEAAVRRHVEHYAQSPDAESEFQREWAQLGEYLQQFGGLDTALRQAAEGLGHVAAHPQPSKSFLALRDRVRSDSAGGLRSDSAGGLRSDSAGGLREPHEK